MPPKNAHNMKCSIDGCLRPYFNSGYCQAHRYRLRKYGDPLKMQHNFGEGNTAEERFWSKVALTADTNRCWEWQGCQRTCFGYGVAMVDGKSHPAHRMAWLFTYGRMPDGILLHSCDNPRCVNPSHLREGTHKENTADMLSRGRGVWQIRERWEKPRGGQTA